MNKENTTLTIKTPKALRSEAKRVAKEMGLPLGTVINALLRNFVAEKEITLSAKEPQPELEKSMRELRAGKGEVYASVDDVFTATDAEK